VDKIQVGAGRRGPITTALQTAFFDYINGVVPDRHGWLTPVQIPTSAPVGAGASKA
jgi:branched-chain amino acid aminotransferase